MSQKPIAFKTAIKITAITKPLKIGNIVFKDVKPGDIVNLSIAIAHTKLGISGKPMMPYILCKNLQNHESCQMSFNQLTNMLKHFELKETEYHETKLEEQL